MNHTRTAGGLSHVAVIVPALNEAESLAQLLPQLHNLGFGQILICDNGSTDDTRAVIETHGATWVFESQRGYGAACYAGIEALSSTTEIVLFLDADLSDDPNRIPKLVAPIIADESDFVIGVRLMHLQEAGSTTFPQRFANWLFPVLIRWGWGHRYTDLGPFRAIRRSALERIGMKDRAFGWTMEMQIRAVEIGLRIHEVPVPYRKRAAGKGKISGTIRGVWLAAYWITRTCVGLWLTRRKRCRAASMRDGGRYTETS